MFNLMVTAGDNAWEEGAYIWDRSRMFEYTDEGIRERFLPLTTETLEQLVGLPTLFMYELGTEGQPRIGSIKRIQQRGAEIRIIHEFDELPHLTNDQIEALSWDLLLHKYEFTRTHWAVKDGDLHEILQRAGIIQGPPAQAEPVREDTEERPGAVEVTPSKVFLVHGRDDGAKNTVARFLEVRLGLDVIILSERPNLGRAILTKFEQEAEGATFAVVLMTSDDTGQLRADFQGGDAERQTNPRARQNVVFELGFFIGKLGAARVCALVAPGIEKPSDYDGIVYVPFDPDDGWQKKLVTELHAADVPVSATWWQALTGTKKELSYSHPNQA